MVEGRAMIRGRESTVKVARKLRSEMSLPETLLWQELRKRPGGHKFRRQHPAGEYVIDIYCAKAALAIEVDGKAHDSGQAVNHGAIRSRWLRRRAIATTHSRETCI
jgi:very-short-patch-repair endonuclease